MTLRTAPGQSSPFLALERAASAATRAEQRAAAECLRALLSSPDRPQCPAMEAG